LGKSLIKKVVSEGIDDALRSFVPQIII